MPAQQSAPPPFCGHTITTIQLELIQKATARYQNLSRSELASTLCEMLGWLRPNGKPKTVECYQYLQKLADFEFVSLPKPRKMSRKRQAVAIQKIEFDQTTIAGTINQLHHITIELVTTAEDRTSGGVW